MNNFLQYLNLPGQVCVIIGTLYLTMNVIGELLEFKGRVVPEFMKIRKYLKRKKKERETLQKLPQMMDEVTALLNNVEKHYNADNIAMRDKWMNWVNCQAKVYDTSIAELEKKMDKNNEITLSLLIDSKRNTIINFAAMVVNEEAPVTREQFNRIFKIHKEYEDIIEANGMTNGEVDIAYRIIVESYEQHMRDHSFIENIRGYDHSVIE